MNQSRFYSSLFFASIIGLFCLMLLSGCSSSSDDNDGHTMTASTQLVSSSLSGVVNNSILVQSVATSGNHLVVTPSNVSGKIMSALYPISTQIDDGVVVFGNNRPDIASVNATLYDFNLAQQLSIQSQSVSIKPNFVGGPVESMILLFGYTDVDFTFENTDYTVRIAMADVLGMQRGDVLLEVGSTFQWFDTVSQTFVSTRPSTAKSIPSIANFTDPIRPQLVFYPLNIFLTQSLNFPTSTVTSASSVSSTVDFAMGGFIVLEDKAGQSGLSTAEIIESLTINQVQNGPTSTGLSASANVTFQ